MYYVYMLLLCSPAQNTLMVVLDTLDQCLARFVQRKLKTLIYMEKLINPQGVSVVIYHEFLLCAAAFIC